MSPHGYPQTGAAAKRNIKSAQQAATRKAHDRAPVRADPEEQLYEIANRENISGRPKMGKWDLIKAIRTAR